MSPTSWMPCGQPPAAKSGDRRVVTALGETRRLMGEIDAAIPVWPMQ